MKTIDWESKYELGIEDIDLQHHYFLNLINHISRAISQKEDKKYIEALVQELDYYAKFHFKSEERLMQFSKYPEYENHRTHHMNLIQHLSIEQYKLLNTSEQEDAEEVINFLFSWFLQHTSVEDRLFAKYLQSQSNTDTDFLEE